MPHRIDYTKLVYEHWPLKRGLLQRGGDWAGPQPTQAPHRCTKHSTHERPVYQSLLSVAVAIAVMRCLSVCPSVRLSFTLVDHIKTNKHIFEIFSPPGSHTILVFPYQTGWQYSDGNPPNGASNAGGNRDSGLIAGYRRLLDVRSCEVPKPFTNDEAEYYDTVGHAPLAMDRSMLDVRTTK